MNAEKKKITIKLDALRDFHAKRDIKVRQDLAKEQELRNNIEGDIKTFADREKFLNDQIEGKFKKYSSAVRLPDDCYKSDEMVIEKTHPSLWNCWTGKDFQKMHKDIQQKYEKDQKERQIERNVSSVAPK